MKHPNPVTVNEIAGMIIGAIVAIILVSLHH